MSQTRRQLATVLFLDIVGSTSLASRIGDARYKELQRRFYRTVRAELKRYGGHEEDTAGDGVFATFPSPTQALRCACATAVAVRELGVETRAGLHTGETELANGKAGGIAVVIGSRVMSLANAGEVLVTSTTKDLVAGSGLEFEDFSAHELKGVPGTWQVFAVSGVDGTPVAGPLEASEAAARLDRIQPETSIARSRRPLIALGAAALALVLVAGAGLAGVGPFQSELATSVMRIDPASNQIVARIQDGLQSLHAPGSLFTDGTNLWQSTKNGEDGSPGTLIRRDLRTGAAQGVATLDTGWGMGFQFGYGWVAQDTDEEGASLQKVDPASATVVATIALPGHFGFANGGERTLWYVSAENDLVELDPIEASIIPGRTFQIDAVEPSYVVPLGDSVWICDCSHEQVLRFDPVAGVVTDHFPINQRAHIIGAAGPDGNTLWLADPGAATITSIDATTGAPGRAYGVGGKRVYYTAIAFGSIWVAAGSSLYRFDLGEGLPKEIAMPPGTSAGGLAIDEKTGTLWVENCGCPDD